MMASLTNSYLFQIFILCSLLQLLLSLQYLQSIYSLRSLYSLYSLYNFCSLYSLYSLYSIYSLELWYWVSIIKFLLTFAMFQQQRPKKSQLSGRQNFTRKNFPDKVRRFFRNICVKSATYTKRA